MDVLKVPFNAGRFRAPAGMEDAPDAIVDSVDRSQLTENGGEVQWGVETVAVDNGSFERSYDSIRSAVAGRDQVRVLGGDHSITKPAVEGFARDEERPGLVVFDAHPDCMDSRDTHEDYLRCLIEDGTVAPEDVILVGIRSWHGQERSFLQEQGIQHFTMQELSREGVQDVCDTVMINMRRCTSVYVSVDIDVVDPAFAPGTGYPEPGGLSTRELLYFLQRLRETDCVTMMDLVEVNPRIDKKTVRVGAKLLVETI